MIRLLALLVVATTLTASDAAVQLPVSAVAQGGNAEQLPLRPSQDEPLILVIHTAEDCPVCKAWRESPSGLPIATKLAERWPLLQVVFVERKRLNGSESEELYPSQLRYMYAARRDRYQLSPPVPLFEIVRGKELLARQSGLQAWSEAIVPAVQRLEGNGESSEAKPSPALLR